MDRIGPDHGRMAKSPQTPPDEPDEDIPPLYIGQWIRAMRKRPRDVVRATGINEGYLSELISGQKDNPSRSIQAKIAKCIGIPVAYFLRPPPGQKTIAEIIAIDPAVLNKLRPDPE